LELKLSDDGIDVVRRGWVNSRRKLMLKDWSEGLEGKSGVHLVI
jgi:hypothetical protein